MSVNDREQYLLKTVIDALVIKLNDTPYSEVSISELCRAADISRMTFYRHFSTKDEVVESYMEYLHQNYLKEVVQKNRFASYIQYENMLLAFQNVKTHIQYVEYLINNNLSEILERKLIENELSLSLRSQQTEEDRYLCVAYASTIYGIMVNWVREGMTTSPEMLSRMIIDLFQDKIKRY